MVVAMRCGRRSSLIRTLTLGTLLGACFAFVWQTKAQDPAVDYNTRGVERDKKGEYDRAIADFNRAIRLDPNDAVAYSNRGNTWNNEKEYDQAIADCNQAIRLDPDFVLAYINRSCAWNGKKEYDRAIADCNQAIKLDPDNALAYNNRGSAWYDKKEYDRAIADCDQAIKLDPHRALAYYNRGGAWCAKKEYARAVVDCNQAIKLDPNYANTYARLAWLQATCPDARFRDGHQAFDNASRACQLNGGKDAEIVDTLAAACAEKGDFEAARKWQAKAIGLSTNEKKKQERRSRLKLYERGRPYHHELAPR
jgi:tetratricopeptide (TPR) repeat protein